MTNGIWTVFSKNRQMKGKETLYDAIARRILVLDGAMGTMIQRYNLTEEDFRGERFKSIDRFIKGNNDILSVTAPAVIEEIHRKYLDAGADIIETNTFNANRVSMEDYGMEDCVPEMNRAAARIARRLADEYTALNPDKPRFVAASVGPTNKTCSISPDVNDPAKRTLTFDVLAQAYEEQMTVLLEEGVDAMLVETIFDTLNAKAAIFAFENAMRTTGREVPLMLSVTISDNGGHTLSGQTLEAFLDSVSHARIFSVGLNCSFGARQMKPYIERLSKIAPCYISAYPNAGLPNSLGEYDQTPEEMAEEMREYVKEGLVNIIGGCCGTTDKFIAAYRNILDDAVLHVPAGREPLMRLSGLEELEVRKDSNFVNVGERCNVAGSRKFLRLIKEKNYDEALSIARSQVENGAQILDINMDDGLLDAKAEMVHFLNLVMSDPDISRVPVMIDSSDWNVIEAGLKCLQGKSVVNSISLKEGEEKFIERASLVKRYGAAAVVMAFDENGQADTFERKIEVCSRAYDLLVNKVGMQPCDIIFDTNILAIGTGIEAHNNYAVDFIKAAEWLTKKYSGVHVSGGVSNLSFAFRGNNYIREALHAVFLYHAISAGMDMGIVNPATAVSYNDLQPDVLEALENLLFNKTSDALDRVLAIAGSMKEQGSGNDTGHKIEWREWDVDARLSHALEKGITDYLEEDINEALVKYGNDAVAIIEGPLMAGMNVVGELFSTGKMFLPQVVKTARTMKKAVAILQPYIEKGKKDASSKAGKILIATVKGDVHDIGKNIVSVVMACNNYDIIDLGVMVPAEDIVEYAKKEKPDVIGLSGLITPSLAEMINVARLLEKEGVHIPLLIGGATTSKLHTALKIAPEYSAPVVHVKDASQNVPVIARLLGKDTHDVFVSALQQEYAALANGSKASREPELLDLETSRKNKINLF